jgi:hypothetical protein
VAGRGDHFVTRSSSHPVILSSCHLVIIVDFLRGCRWIFVVGCGAVPLVERGEKGKKKMPWRILGFDKGGELSIYFPLIPQAP